MASVLVLGAGGRENVLAWKLSQSLRVGQVYVCPGNAGTSLAGGIIKRTEINVKSHDDVISWCKANNINLVVIGPEDYLADGFSDALNDSGIPCFGPSSKAAQIESSKAFSKALMTKYEIPTAEWAAFNDANEACNFINNAKFPALVVKASGLAAGKGVIVAKDKEEACRAATDMLQTKSFGDAGSTIVVEELLEGEEVSCMAFCDGKTLVCMPPSQDHKRLLEGDEGPNTGGMGAYCPVPKVTGSMMKEIEEKVLVRTLKVMEEEGYPFVGVLYAGMMLTPNGPKVLEFNCRFGDPETQAILPLLKSDLYEIMEQCVSGKLDQSVVVFETDKFALGIVLASEGYPGTVKKNIPITNLDVVEKQRNVNVFHSGTAFDENDRLVTCGGRVMTVVATSDSLESALSDAKKASEAIHFEGKQFRSDIGWRSLNKKPSLTYKDSGVDIHEGDMFVGKIKPLAASTSRSGVMGCVGSFGAMFDLAKVGYEDPLLVSGTDGVGTKLKIAQMLGRHDTIGIDLVAMCVNDVLCHGAEPLFFLDYFSCGKLRSDMAVSIIEGISDGCKMAGCALVGGETAEMPGMYQSEEYDLAGFAVGAVERSNLLPSTVNKLVEGDVAIGIASSGFHSNGFSLVRKVLDVNGISLSEKCPFDDSKTVGECVLAPTNIYVKCLLPLMKKGNVIKAAAHITGGGLPGNVERVVPNELVVNLNALNWNIPPVFSWIQALGNISQEEMLKTFNCGVGMVVFVDSSNVDKTLDEIKVAGFESSCVGYVSRKEGDQASVIVENLSKSLKRALNFDVKSKTVEKKKVAVLISGSGTNLQSLIDSSHKVDSPYYVGLVVSNVASAYGLQRAAKAGIPTTVIDHKNFKDRIAFDSEVHKRLSEHNIELVCLAGFMRILSDQFVKNWNGKMLNIHPSLLPSFKGLHVHKSVLEAGCMVSGCTVHFVSNELDGGAIIAQEAVKVLPGDSEDDLCERVKTAEHKAYPEALRLLASGRVSLGENGKVIWSK